MILTVEAARSSVRIDVTVASPKNRLLLSRTSPSGAYAEVRSWAPGTVAPGAVIARDFEVPIGVPVTYTADSWQDPAGAHTLETGTITVPAADSCDTWLTDLVRAGNSQRVTIEALAELAHDVPATVHQILGRRPPIVVSDIAQTPTFDLSFLTDSDTERDAARSTLGNGAPVLLRTPPDWGIGNLYFAVLAFGEGRIVTEPTQQARRWSVSAVQVERPDADLFVPLGPVTYADVKATFGTYADLKAGRATYDAVLYDWAGADPTDVVPWPPDDA